MDVGPNASASGIDSELVEVAFGLRSFRNSAGLYFAAFDAEEIDLQERVQYTGMIKELPPRSGQVAAGEFSFYGFRFILWTEAAELPNSVTIGGRETKLLYHINSINLDLNTQPSQRMVFLRAW